MKLYEMVFSPTGGTKRAADILAEEIGLKRQVIDLTRMDTVYSDISISPEDVCLAAVPSYGGRVPQAAAERIRQIKGSGAGQLSFACMETGLTKIPLRSLKTSWMRRDFSALVR